MKHLLYVLGILPFLLLSYLSHSQSSGYIIRPATTTTGKAILDPGNPSGYTSKTTAGFSTDDVANSKVPYKTIPALSYEPFGDLRRGPNHLYSDFVPDANGNGYYMYYDGTNLLFRFRLGSLVPGAKGYSILIDTDNKFGATGANADSNYRAATTGVNGNPGFEIEIDLFTQNSSNPGVAIYDVDGTSSPVLVKSYNDWQNYSQVSIAATSDNGDPDFFLDFYVPFSDLTSISKFGITASTPLRFSATTVMAPLPSIGGPKSDIYGLNDGAYKDPNAEYEAYINASPAMAVTALSGSGTGVIGAMCTAAPTIESATIGTGTAQVQGSWTKSSLSGAAAAAATITVYVNGVAKGTTTATSGTPWVLSNTTIASGDLITAKAQAAGESMCLVSNTFKVTNCSAATIPPAPILTCTSSSGNQLKGTGGSNIANGYTIHIQNVSRGTAEETATFNNTTTTVGNFGFTANSNSWTWYKGCSGGPNITSGSYRIWYTNAAGCSSNYTYYCASGGGSDAITPATVPTVTTPSGGLSGITINTKKISGAADANSTVSLWVNRVLVDSVKATSSGTYTFPSGKTSLSMATALNFVAGDSIYLTSQLNQGNSTTLNGSKCASFTAGAIVSCYTAIPVISADADNQIKIGQPITGTASPGATVKVYTSAAALVSTVTVQNDGSWSTSSGSPVYTTAVNTTYYATSQSGSCVSANSANVSTASGTTAATRCGTITSPVASSATTVSGTLVSSATATKVNLYLDGYLIDSATNISNSTTWGPINVANKLYPNGVLTIGIQETGKEEVRCGNAVTISCSSVPASPTISPTNTTIAPNKSVTYTLSNVVSGTYYGIADSITGQSLADGVWATSNADITVTTKPIASAGTYNVVVKATSLAGGVMCSSLPKAAKVNVSSVLPVNLLNFKGSKSGKANLLEWNTGSEINTIRFEVERSMDGIYFTKLGEKTALGSNSSYSFEDLYPFATANYYRLKIVDNGGYYAYSKTILIHENATGVAINTVQPNPFTNEVSVNVLLPKEQSLQVVLFDGTGRQVKVKSVNGVRGMNTITFTSLSGLSDGLYLIKVITGNEELQQKLLKKSN